MNEFEEQIRNVEIPQFDRVGDMDESNESNGDLVIPQFDGGCGSESPQDKKLIVKNLFAIKCEIQEIASLVNFFRNF